MDINKNRIWELDFFRGIALILMVYFHLIYDLNEIYGYPLNYASGVNYYIGKISAILFMLISGISCFLSRNNYKRGIKVFVIALAITIATYFAGPEFIIKFGILHFLGISMLLSPIFKKLNPYVLIIVGILIIIMGIFFSTLNPNFDYLFPFGITSNHFYSSDYYPIFPWFGVFGFGIVTGKLLYAKRESLLNFQIGKNPISMFGRHTLIIYLVHQPLILLVLWIISYLRGL